LILLISTEKEYSRR